MIEIPEGAQFVRQGSGRVDVKLLPGDTVEFSGRVASRAMVFRSVGDWWDVVIIGESGNWEAIRIDSEVVPDRVKELLMVTLW